MEKSKTLSDNPLIIMAFVLRSDRFVYEERD
jgi:hypothetical protein